MTREVTNRVVITLEGGIIQNVLADKNVEINVFDFDVEGSDDRLTEVEGSQCAWLQPMGVYRLTADRSLA